MSSRSKKLRPNALYNMDERRLKAVAEEKDLGISSNDNLTFEKHINEKVNKANSLVGMVRRTLVHLDKDVFKVLCMYCSTTLGIRGTNLEPVHKETDKSD